VANVGFEKDLTSLWDGLSDHLIASFYEVDRHGEKVTDPDGNPINIVVRAPLTESSLDVSLNWQSAFESMSPESKAPMLFAMLQSGALQPVIDSLNPQKAGVFSDKVSGAQQKSADFLKQFEGRTGMTKLNSTQIFSGMPPIKIQITALFRAWRDPVSEVRDPVDQLMAWAFPEKLADDSLVANFSKAAQGEMNPIDALLPSKSPKLIAMRYKNRTYKPFVIESITVPLASPVDSSGEFVELLIPMTLCSLTAWDKGDWANTSGNNR
jgi:hypothetical protein